MQRLQGCDRADWRAAESQGLIFILDGAYL